MLKYSNNQALCLMDYKGEKYLLNLGSGPLKGYTSVFMWFFPKSIHCLAKNELAVIKEEHLFSGKTPPIILLAGLGTLAYTVLGQKMNSFYFDLHPLGSLVLIILAIIFGVIFDVIIKRKDQLKVKLKLGNINYEKKIKIKFISTKDKFIYIVKMLFLGFVGLGMFIGYGIFLTLWKSNPIGLIVIFVGSWILFGTSKLVPSRYEVEIF